jgi:transposase
MAGNLHTGVRERRSQYAYYPVALAATPAAQLHRAQDGPASVSLGRPMACDRRLVPRSPRDLQRWTPARPVPRVPRRNPLDINHWQPLERFTRTISLSVHVLEAAPRLEPQRRLRKSLGSIAGQDGSSAADQLGRSDRRRLVFTGKKGGDDVGRIPKGNGTRILLMVDAKGIPLSSYITAANHNEVNTVETLVDECRLRRRPRRLLYDKAADADWLRDRLKVRNIELICAHRSNRKKPSRQDGRSLRRYARRYRVERTISWLHNYRRIITRWEYYPELFEGFVHLACLYTILKRF